MLRNSPTLLAIFVFATACFVDSASPPPGAIITCAADDECPGGFVCPPALGTCVSVDGRDEDAPVVTVIEGPDEVTSESGLTFLLDIADDAGLAATLADGSDNPRADVRAANGEPLIVDVDAEGDGFRLVFAPAELPEGVDLEVRVSAVDAQGNELRDHALPGFILDRTPPSAVEPALPVAARKLSADEGFVWAVTMSERIAADATAELVPIGEDARERSALTVEIGAGPGALTITGAAGPEILEGFYAIELTAADLVGNVDTARIADLEVDKSGPAELALLSLRYTRDNEETGVLLAARPETRITAALLGEAGVPCADGVPQVRIDSGGAGLEMNALSGLEFERVIAAGDPVGEFPLRAHVCDDAGNVSDVVLADAPGVIIYDDQPLVLTVHDDVHFHRTPGFDGLANRDISGMPADPFTVDVAGRSLTHVRFFSDPQGTDSIVDARPDQFGAPISFPPNSTSLGPFVFVRATDFSGAVSALSPVHRSHLQLIAPDDFEPEPLIDVVESARQLSGAFIAPSGNGADVDPPETTDIGNVGGGNIGGLGVGEPFVVSSETAPIMQPVLPAGVIPDGGECTRLVEDREGGRLLAVSENIDIWAYDGFLWERLPSPTVRPAPRGCPGVTWIPRLSLLALFGGDGESDLWVWDGVEWFLIDADATDCAGSATQPSCRASAGFTWDPLTERFLLHGGLEGATRLGDTWQWPLDTANWAEMSAGTAPGNRAEHSLVADESNGEVLLIGGTGAGASIYRLEDDPLAGEVWTDLSPDLSGFNLARPTIAVNSDSHGVVIATAGAQLVQLATWEDGTFTPIALPVEVSDISARQAGFAVHNRSGTIVLHGGVGRVDQVHLRLDALGSVSHARVRPGFSQSPPNRSQGATASITEDARAVLFGGRVQDAVADGQTWLWDGVSWFPFDIAGPGPRCGHGLTDRGDALDPGVVLAGGVDCGGPGTALKSTWELTLSPLGWVQTGDLPVAIPDPIMATDPICGPTLVVPESESPLAKGTYRYAGAVWQLVESSDLSEFEPPALESAELIFVPGRLGAPAGLLLVGDDGAEDAFTEVHALIYDGNCGGTWVPIATVGDPPPADGSALAYDGTSDRVIMIGGAGAPESENKANWFELDLDPNTGIGTWSSIPNQFTASKDALTISDGLNDRWILLEAGGPGQRVRVPSAQASAAIHVEVTVAEQLVPPSSVTELIPALGCSAGSEVMEWAATGAGTGAWLPQGSPPRALLHGLVGRYAVQCRLGENAGDDTVSSTDATIDLFYLQ